jgi:hypothetical protein
MCTAVCTRLRSPYDGQALPESTWCDECKSAHAAYLDDQGHLADLSVRQHQLDLYVPATDEEWMSHLEDVAPLIEDLVLVPASMPCPLCSGGKTITVPTDLARSGSIRATCPWCGGEGQVPDLPDWHYPDLSDRKAS